MEEMEYSREVFTLTDEDGNEHEFELWDILETDGNVYYGLIPYMEDPQAMVEEDTELVILKVGKDEETGEEYLATIDNDEEYDRIGQMFLEKSFEDEEEDAE